MRIKSSLFRLLSKLKYFGFSRYCCICQSSVRTFLPHGVVKKRPDARCPVCGSLERHRFDWYFLTNSTNLLEPSKKVLLHFAPEKEFYRKFYKLKNIDYITSDLNRSNVRVNADICDLPFEDNSIDIIYCSHVLEHVPDDIKGLHELYRILKDQGWGLIQVPVVTEKTYEDGSIVDPQKRKEVFGHQDHVRNYGWDFEERLRQCGFDVRIYKPSDLLSEKQVTKLGMHNCVIFYCTKKGSKELTSDPE